MKPYLVEKKGLTLIELMMVIVIVAILGAVAIVSYRSYLVRARLQDAKVALETVRAEEEQYRAEFGRYAPSNSLNFFSGIGNTATVGDYGISISVPDTANYTAMANPQTTRQSFAASSKYGGWLTIDEDGNRNSQASAGTWP